MLRIHAVLVLLLLLGGAGKAEAAPGGAETSETKSEAEADEGSAEVCRGAGARACDGEPSSLLQSQTSRPELLGSPQLALQQQRLGGVITCEVEAKFIKVNNRRYSRYKAHDALLGSYGPEMAGAYYPPHLSFEEPPEDAWLEGNSAFGLPVRIASSQAGSFGIDLSTSAIPMVDIEVSGHGNHSHNGSYFLKPLRFGSLFRLQQSLNKPEFDAFRAHMKQMDRPRITTTVWIVLEGDPESASICAGGALTLKVKDAGKIVVSGSGCSMSTWEFSPGAVVAYESAKFKWNEDGTIKDLKIDFYTR